jgi:hypothetical protein
VKIRGISDYSGVYIFRSFYIWLILMKDLR